MPGWLEAFITANPVIVAAADRECGHEYGSPRRRLALKFPNGWRVAVLDP